MKGYENRIFKIRSEQDFNELALELFQFQSAENPVYREFLKLLRTNSQSISHYTQIPFLPISFFKSMRVQAGKWEPELEFTSSATTSAQVSRHFVKDKLLYESSFNEAFSLFYGDPSEYAILALLPSYLERSGSSLVYMAQKLIERSTQPGSGFYLNEIELLAENLQSLRKEGRPTILLGVTFALLEMAEKYPIPFPDLIVMETGGMKGRGKELTRVEVHQRLKSGFGVQTIHSEYGMTELLSQAYSSRDGLYSSPPWMKISIRQIQDPLSAAPFGLTGGINIIDLANRDSCGFIAVEDLGKLNNDGTFEVLGRFDQSDVRGCNLMAL